MICCTANTHASGVEIYLGNTDKERNKEAFDYLLQNKSAIEKSLNVELTWSRRDDAKSSKVYMLLSGVNIEDDTDWPRMAKFHSEWSKKFYDVIVPYITVDWQ